MRSASLTAACAIASSSSTLEKTGRRYSRRNLDSQALRFSIVDQFSMGRPRTYRRQAWVWILIYKYFEAGVGVGHEISDHFLFSCGFKTNFGQVQEINYTCSQLLFLVPRTNIVPKFRDDIKIWCW